MENDGGRELKREGGKKSVSSEKTMLMRGSTASAIKHAKCKSLDLQGLYATAECAIIFFPKTLMSAVRTAINTSPC